MDYGKICEAIRLYEGIAHAQAKVTDQVKNLALLEQIAQKLQLRHLVQPNRRIVKYGLVKVNKNSVYAYIFSDMFILKEKREISITVSWTTTSQVQVTASTPKQFVLKLDEGSFKFEFDTEQEAMDWVKCLEEVFAESKAKKVQQKTTSTHNQQTQQLQQTATVQQPSGLQRFFGFKKT